MERDAWHDELRRNPNAESGPLTETRWQEITHSLLIGSEVAATVAGRAPFGLWLDVGVPALMRIVDTDRPVVDRGAEYEAYRRGEWGALRTELRVTVTEVEPRPGYIIVWGNAESWKTT